MSLDLTPGKDRHPHSSRFKNDSSLMHENQPDAAQHTPLGVSFSWKNENSGQKDGYLLREKKGVGVCVR